MKQHFLLASALFMFAACSEPVAHLAENNIEQKRKEKLTSVNLSPEELGLIEASARKTPKISPSEAKETVLQLFNMNQVQTDGFNLTASVLCNKRSVYNSLSKSYSIEEDTALYVFNASDDQGFAIMAADVRVPSQVLAFSDKGSFEISDDNPMLGVFLDLAKDYVADCITVAQQQEDSLKESIYAKFGIKINEDTESHSLSKYKREQIRCTNVGPATITLKSKYGVNPLTKTSWHQEASFNLKAGYRYAGCAPIAVSQLLAYWHYPYSYNSKVFNWDLILNGDTASADYKDQVSLLVNMTRIGMGTVEGTTKSNRPLEYLRSLKCSTLSKMKKYDYYAVTEALDKNIPVFIGGANDLGDGHCWIADGYLNQTVVKDEVVKYMIVETFDDGSSKYYYEDIPTSTTTYYELLHFNWGWGGHGDGFYSRNVFDTDKRMEEYNNGYYYHPVKSDVKKRHYYNSQLEIITDIKPRY